MDLADAPARSRWIRSWCESAAGKRTPVIAVCQRAIHDRAIR